LTKVQDFIGVQKEEMFLVAQHQDFESVLVKVGTVMVLYGDG
tara:strand:+ start:173921 stop:174046 length:126 start_codon:yes stop_codon:yes gene_type:complete